MDKRPIIGDTSITILPAAPSTVPAIFARNDFIFKIAGEEVFKTYRAEDGSSAGTVEPFTYIDNAKLYVTDMNWNIAFDLLMESPETAGVLYQIIADKLYVTCFELREEEILTFRFSWA